eukprot:scaffold313033_cov41-Prasinocladus_malaysianus.AAC.1
MGNVAHQSSDRFAVWEAIKLQGSYKRLSNYEVVTQVTLTCWTVSMLLGNARLKYLSTTVNK